MSSLIQSPDPGVFLDVPAHEYHSWKLASNSMLSILKRSPAHMKAYRDCPPPPSDAMELGDAIHMAILQPLLFLDRFEVAPEQISNKNTNAWKEFEAKAVSQGKVALKASQGRQIEAVASQVRAHPTVSKLISHPNAVEVSAVFDLHDVRCKMRCDLLNDKFATILDLKSTTDASRDSFIRSVANYGYFRQAAMYIDGWRAIGKEYKRFVLIAIEKDPPYGVAIYRLTDDFIDAGRVELKKLLSLYAECERTNVWPSYPLEVQELAAPAWLKEAA